MDSLNEQDRSHKRTPDAPAASSINDEPPSKRAKLDSLTAAAAPAVDDGAAAPSFAVATVAAAATASPLSAAQRCDRDSLSVIFSCCERIGDIATAARTCHSWRAAALLCQSDCCADVSLARAAFLQMLQSPLRFHLFTLTLCEAISGEDLLQAHTRWPQLEELTVEVDGTSLVVLVGSAEGAAAFNAHAWPSSLRSMFIRMRDADPVGLQPLLDTLPSAAGLEEVFLLFRSGDPAVSLSPLLQLHRLTRFHVNCCLLPEQLLVVKQLRSLTQLGMAVGQWTLEDLRLLLVDGPHQLQRLKNIDVSSTRLDDNSMQALMTLPNLTELQPVDVDPHCFPLLRSFTKLRKLRVSSGAGDVSDPEAADLLSSLRAMPDLTNLKIRDWSGAIIIKTALLDGLGAAVPQLRKLSLSQCRALPPLNGLSTCAQLRKLKMTRCRRAASTHGSQPIDDVLQLLRSLRHIEHVELRYCSPPLTDAQRAQLTPPSLLIPSLKHFHWA
jgi:hypothetical protein